MAAWMPILVEFAAGLLRAFAGFNLSAGELPNEAMGLIHAALSDQNSPRADQGAATKRRRARSPARIWLGCSTSIV